jgi:hypothetical protein
VTGNKLTDINAMVKIIVPVQGICRRRYIDVTKLIFVVFER